MSVTVNEVYAAEIASARARIEYLEKLNDFYVGQVKEREDHIEFLKKQLETVACDSQNCEFCTAMRGPATPQPPEAGLLKSDALEAHKDRAFGGEAFNVGTGPC